MGSNKTFAEVLNNAPPRPPERPTAWEAYLLSIIQNLQKENASLQQQMQELEKQTAEKKEETTPSTVHKEVISILNTKQEEVKGHIVQEVISTINEEKKVEEIANSIRVGGLREGWQTVDVIEPEEIEKDTFLCEAEEMMRRAAKAIPFIDIGDPDFITVKGNHIILHYSDIKEKIEVMKQTRSLKGTSVWMADELTPLQLKNRKQELAKVTAARKQGKWAVYRRGKALIEEFRTSKKPYPTTP